MRIQAPRFRSMKQQFSSKRSAAKLNQELSSSFAEECPSIAESDVSSVDFGFDTDSVDDVATDRLSSMVAEVIPENVEPQEKTLNWEFKGLTLWVEFEEHDHDLSRAIDDLSTYYGTESFSPHATLIYGMKHLTEDQAKEKLREVSEAFPQGWPCPVKPVSVKQDLAVAGRPGQVCTIAWAELTLKTNEQHEEAMNKLYDIFDVPDKRSGPWTPHISLAYDNPEDSVLTLNDTICYVAVNPSLMEERRIKAVSLWSTEGKMAQWKCLDRVSFF